MGRLTSDERQRVFQARDIATRETLSRRAGASMPAEPPASGHRRRQLAPVGVIPTIPGGWFASPSVVLHRLALFAEARSLRL